MPDPTPIPMPLGQKQRTFTKLLAQLILHVYGLGYELTLADGSIDPVRKGKPVGQEHGPIVVYRDCVHLVEGQHYRRLAQDLNLFIGGKWITDGSHPAWTEIGTFWEGLNPLCRWGGRFAKPDANHFSLFHEGHS